MKRQLAFVLVLSLLVPELAPAQADQNPAPVSQTTQAPGSKPVPPKDDVNAIGSRKIGDNGFGNWYPLENDISLGKQYAALIEADVGLVKDEVVSEYVNRIGQKLVRNSDARVIFTIKVIDSEEVNAFSLPGGFLYVNYGLIMATEGEAELAGVMAHEIAHVAARHTARQKTRTNLFNLISLPLSFAGIGVAVSAVQAAAGIGGPMALLKFSRGFEAEADYLGLQYMYAAGYDPQAYISLLERIGAQQKKTGTVGGWLATHPKTRGRVQKGQEEIARILPARDVYVVNTSEFDDVKARLYGANKQYNASGRQFSGPILRKRTASSENGKTDSKRDDVRPTVKRRND